MRKTVLLAVTVGLLGLGPTVSVSWAQHGGHGGGGAGGHGGHNSDGWAAERVRSGKAKGSIVQLEPAAITIETQTRHGAERVAYRLDGGTRVKGALTMGAEVTVKYRDQYGLLTATKIVVRRGR